MNHFYSQTCSPFSKFDLEIKVKLSNKAKKVTLIYGDPHNFIEGKNNIWTWQKKETEMALFAKTSENCYFSALVHEDKSRFRYYFKIEFEDGSIFFNGQDGNFLDDEGEDFDIYSTYFYPYVHAHEVFKGPEWVKDQIWLQIFVDRFHNGDKTNDPEDVLPWGQGEPTGHTFHGGDLRGIIQKLEYIKDLGYTGIYLTPIFLAPSAHKYDTLDYMQIDPAFGTKEDLKELVNKAHELGLKIMLDAVFNHASSNHAFFKDVEVKLDKSKYFEYFHITSTDPFDYEMFSRVRTMPKWNTRNKLVRDYFLKVLFYYIEEFGIDAWRFDVANELDHTFVKEINREIKGRYPDFYLLAEVWHDPSSWISYDQFDGNMEYEIMANFVKLLNKTISVDLAIERLAEIQYRTPLGQYVSQFHMINSHDTMRLLNMLKGDKDKALLAMFILNIQKGSICGYYGDEYLMEGANDPYCRRCLPLNPSKEELEIKERFKKILEFRKKNLETINNNLAFYAKSQKGMKITYDDLEIEIDLDQVSLMVNGQKFTY